MSAQQLQAILQMAAQNPPPQRGSPAQLRAWFDASNSQMPPAPGLSIQSLRISDAAGGTLMAELLSTPQADPRRLVIYYHAGGFVCGSLASHRALCSYLAQFSGAQVLNVAYRLAPEHPAPAAHDDALAAYQWALALSPALDLASEGASHHTVDDPFITRELMGFFNAMYVPGGDVRSPAVTPFYGADLRGLPPMQLQVGARERLRDDAVTMAARLNAAGVAVECTVWEGMVHCWQLFAPALDEAMASLEQAGRFIAAHQR